MSLAGQTMPVRESVHSSREQVATEQKDQQQSQRSSYRDSLPNAPRPPVYNEDAYNENDNDKMYREYYDDMPATSPKKAQPQQSAPALPAKSSLRASRLLDGMALKIITNQPTTTQAPQEVYLSSEEEASSSADEFSDYGYDSDTEESADSPVRRKSHEDTARVVSVVYAGKPSIVDLPSTRRSASPESMESRPPSRPCSRLVTSATAPSLRRMSTSSTSASSFSPILHPPRSSSMMITSSMLPKERPSFLNIDPCPTPTYEERTVEEDQRPVEVERPERPKTPTSALFRRTLSIVRKRSRPQLRDLAAANSSRDQLSSPSMQNLPLSANSDITYIKEEPEQAAKTPNSPWAAVSYHEIMRAAKKNSQTAQPPTPSTPSVASPVSPAPGNTRNRILSGLRDRRKSIKIG
ncbi:hypothetical protein KHU50_002000 [Colletotrichum sp. SAR 10_65]|nr:hypothetical protein KHU50_002000 [Colletotrichum sp. SAR 10_65]KAI8191464.1 hypothetical protein K4K51_011779 [Colletotrichum sp. SAR 10_75]KAJ5000411.1 hypothetical protein K4K48_002697 [Colletotrichum sp. SAR 10_66]